MKWGILAAGTIAAKFAKTVAATCSDEEKLWLWGREARSMSDYNKGLDMKKKFYLIYPIPKHYE